MELKIESILLRNVLSFQDTLVRFDDLSIILGPNASGKSNFIKVLNFLKGIASTRTIDRILRDNFHYTSLDEFFNDPDKPILIQVNFKHGRYDAHYLITFQSRGYFISEELSYRGSNIYSLGHTNSRTVIFGYENDNIGFRLIRNYLQNISSYSFVSDQIRVVHRITGATQLMPDGENVSQLLNRLLMTDRDTFFRIEDKIKSIFPFIERVNMTPTEDEYQTPSVSLSLKERGKTHQIHYNNISDGTLRIIAFITALELKSSLITFEEPENCVHPSLFETLVDLFKKSDKQIIVTTHSPYLLNWVNVESIRLFSRAEKGTKVSSVSDIDKIRSLMQDGYPIGDLWFEGRLDEE